MKMKKHDRKRPCEKKPKGKQNTKYPPPPSHKKTKQNKTSHKPKARKHNKNFKLFVLPLALFVYL